MTSQAVQLTSTRLLAEEGKRSHAYNDATGATVSCKPGGNLTIGVGLNLENGLEDEEIVWLLQNRLGRLEAALGTLPWYTGLDDVRRSVALDIAFNQGIGGLAHYPKMIAALEAGDWATAALQCTVQDPRLKARYEGLAKLLKDG